MLKKLIALVLCLPLSGLPLFAYGQGNTFDKVRYNGGSVQTTVKPDEWGNKLTVTADETKSVATPAYSPAVRSENALLARIRSGPSFYWPGAQSAEKLVIVGEPALDHDSERYLTTLRERFSLPIEYQQFDVVKGTLVRRSGDIDLK